MKFIKRHPVLSIFAGLFSLPFLAICVIFLIYRIEYYQEPVYDSFDIAEEGLVAVKLVGIGGYNKVEEQGYTEYLALATGKRCMKIDAFKADETKKYMVSQSSFSPKMDYAVVKIELYDEEGHSAPVTQEVSDICHAMKEIDHHVMELTIFRAGEEWFAVAGLNVNLWTPYYLYYYNRDTRKLTLLYVFANQYVDELRILSPERLKTFEGEIIGSQAASDTPEEYYESKGETVKDEKKLIQETFQ